MSKLIIIPPNFNFNPAQDMKVHAPLSTTSIPSDPPHLYVQSQPILVDLLRTYTSWYNETDSIDTMNYDSTFHIDNNNILNTCWNKTEIIDWINANAMSEVLLQPALHSGSYPLNGTSMNTFYFRNTNDKDRFQKWWSGKKKEFQYLIRGHGMKIRDIAAWVNEHITGRKTMYVGDDYVNIAIKDPKQAMQFKLTWVGND